MIIYQEEKTGNKSIFIKTVTNDAGKVLYQRKVMTPLYIIDHQGQKLFLLYDDNMNVIHDAYAFLNEVRGDKPFTTRKTDAAALRLLYSYLSLSNTDIRAINDTSFRGLKAFLRGVTGRPDGYGLKTVRMAATVNHYFSIYRLFFTARNIPCQPLFNSKLVKTQTMVGNDYAEHMTRQAYTNNVKMPSKLQQEVPMYISPDQFQKLYGVILDAHDATARLIVHLAYGYGLRLGEILGLTTEDIQERRENGILTPVLILRNRVSDRPFQYAKNLVHPLSTDDYRKDAEYRQSNSVIHITYDLYDQLIDYINQYHEKMMRKYPENYNKGVADIVSYVNAPEANHYVFLNKYGAVLSDQTWNNTLKSYYAQTGIVTDHGCKKCNLTHRLRHGFAMFKAHFSEHPVDVLKLKMLMRHRSISSTLVYYTPTDEDILKIKTEFQEDLYNVIPELRGDNDGC